MKKLNLSIPTPCHENWEQMTQAEKGKFCGACQKTVVDFTSMSDRQLVDFFKKPKADVCGRFNNDQLEREILIPRKRIPWIRYFFQFTWPAFMLGLKSCTNPTIGKVKGESESQPPLKEIKITSNEFDTIRFSTFGFAVPEITPYKKQKIIKCSADKIIGDLMVTIDNKENKEDTIQSGASLEPVIVKSYSTTGFVSYLVGAVSSRVIIDNTNMDTIPTIVKNVVENNVDKFLAYPNPVNAGSMLTVKFPENNIPEKIQLFSISGQIIATVEQDISDYATMCNLRIPSHVSSGVYFLRLISKNKIINTTKIVVNK